MTRVVALLVLAAFFLLGVPGPVVAVAESAGDSAVTQVEGRLAFPAVAGAAEPATHVSVLRVGGEQRTASGAQSEDGLCEEFSAPAPEPVTRLETAGVRSAEPGGGVHERGPPRTDRTAA
jgi:hypothetical protein